MGSDADGQAGRRRRVAGRGQAHQISRYPALRLRKQVEVFETQAADPGDWWDDPSLPWRHRPSRRDIVCFTWLGIATAYGIVISILRPGLLGTAPQLLVIDRFAGCFDHPVPKVPGNCAANKALLETLDVAALYAWLR